MIEKITYIYETLMPKLPVMLEHNEALDYFNRLMLNGNIITYIVDDELLGFLEFWRVNYEQFGRMCCNVSLTHDEDLLNGQIAVITRMYIVPDQRNSEVFLNLARLFLYKNITATHFVALQAHKHHKPIQVYTRNEILKHYKLEK